MYSWKFITQDYVLNCGIFLFLIISLNKIIHLFLFTEMFLSFLFSMLSKKHVTHFIFLISPLRTGSKLGISPLMLAAMNGHVPAVKLLLDMGSDINAQIETNRNTALTLACFQGRAEVVSLLLDRKANVEHRAKVSTL